MEMPIPQDKLEKYKKIGMIHKGKQAFRDQTGWDGDL